MSDIESETQPGQAPCGPSDIDDYDAVVRVADELQRPIAALLALAPQNDPFLAGRPGRRRDAEWFAEVWKRLQLGSGIHLRRIHYRLVSHDIPMIGADGAPYENTDNCWKALVRSARDARYLGLVPVEDFVDRRNDDAIEFSSNTGQEATLSVSEPFGLSQRELPESLGTLLPEPARFEFVPPVIDQNYLVEIWVEKSTINDIIVPLARRYGLNVVAGTGEISLTHCRQLIERTEESERPARILYISDFDPAGLSMPVTCARKIEFLLRRDRLDLDIQVRPIVLTHDQCIAYRLPRTPLKESERRTTAFEARYGEGATELDALEALHPGELRRILEQEILRYYDVDLDHHIEDADYGFRDELIAAHQEVLDRHADDRRGIEEDYVELISRVNPELKRIREQYSGPLQEIADRFNALQQRITEELEEEAPDLDAVDWPEPEDGDEDDDPLFDSNREYIEQVNRYKRHQGKPIDKRRGPNNSSRRAGAAE
jgi:hypothetical protein